jgi:solute carrier family 39 (zinc transporter), member 7
MVVSTALIAALLSTGLVSLAPNLVLLIFPNYGMGEGTHSQLLSLGQAMAAGGLLGDVFLHTLPHAAHHDQKEDSVGGWVLVGFVIFLVADSLMRWADPTTTTSSSHNHNHGNHDDKKKDDNDNDDKTKQEEPSKKGFHMTPKMLLNLTGDAMHNFTDGLAIGASFSIQATSSNTNNTMEQASVTQLVSSRGGLATVSILLHELPHELGDFATLVKAGCSKTQAILLQFITAGAALAGAVVGVLAVEGYGGETLLYITAGGFIYLACVTILPEVLEEKKASLKFRVAQVLCFCSGVAFLYAVAVIEHHTTADGHHGHSHHSHHDHHDHHHQEEDHHPHHHGHHEEHSEHDHRMHHGDQHHHEHSENHHLHHDHSEL